MENKSREHYLRNISIGNIVAFMFENKMISGKVVDISKDKGIYTISTHNGSIFYVKKNSIVWVKMGSRWPVGIYNALKYRGN